MKRINALSRAFCAYNRCIASGNTEWRDRHAQRIEDFCDSLPSGSGFDDGIKFLRGFSQAEKLVFQADFHHMNEGGYYDGWSHHTVTITPSLEFGFAIKVSGRDRNQIKEYIAETLEIWASEEISEFQPANS